MEKNISEKVEDLIKTNSPDNAQLNEFIRANEEYQKLIQEGLTMKRGFNILTTEEIYNPALNCSHSQPSQRLHL
ncbi:MAG: hypothetical protein WC865_11345 [Bacteroidales bacterium]